MTTTRLAALALVLAGTAAPTPAVAQERATFRFKQGNTCTSLAFSPDSKVLAGTFSDGTVRLFDPGKKAEVRALRGLSHSAYLLAFSADGKTLVALGPAFRDGERLLCVKRWDVATGEERASVFFRGQVPLELGPGGKVLVTKQLPQENTFRLWDTTTAEELAAVRLSAGFAAGAVFLPGGQAVALRSAGGTVIVWDIARGKERARFRGRSVRAIAPDGKTAAGWDHDEIFLWDLTTGKGRLFRTRILSAVELVRFSPDGKLLALAGSNPAVHLWEVDTHKPRALLKGHGDKTVVSMAFSPDGKLLATADISGVLKVWDVPRARK